jgi:3-dehydroquinate dehydratase/shikimate dehydrogenase
MAELRRRRDEVSAAADLVELRLDSVGVPDVAGALEGRTKPAIVTCRPAWEGGGFTGAEEERKRLLGQALAGGAEYVDLEWRARFDDLLQLTHGRRVVLSAHEFDRLPDDLEARAGAMRATGAEVVKLAVPASRLSDCIVLRDLGTRLAKDGAVVVIAMGERGLVSRVLPERFGSAWTYAGAIAGVGQVTPRALVGEYRYAAIGPETALYGLVGSPIGHSVSPAMHNAAFRSVGRDAVYLPFPAADADDFVAFARAFDVRGASVTIPFKVALFERVDEAFAVARRIGAINTICRENGRLLGGNTDAAGLLHPLQAAGVQLRGMRTAILGAGGAARAATVALAGSGAEVTVHARSAEAAGAVARLAAAQVGGWPPAPGSWDLLVNCTPVGMHPRSDETPLPAAALTGQVVYDLIYNPRHTRLLREARLAGCRTIGGLEMLVAQAEEQFEWWTGLQAPAGVMRAAAIDRLAEFTADEDYVA